MGNSATCDERSPSNPRLVFCNGRKRDLFTELDAHHGYVRDALTQAHESIVFTLVPRLVELSSRAPEVDNALQLPHSARELLFNFGMEVQQVHRSARVLLKAPCEYTVRIAEQIRGIVDAYMGPLGRGLPTAERCHKQAQHGAKVFRLTKIHFCACLEKLTWLVDGGGLDYIQATVDKFVHVAKGETKELKRQEKILLTPKDASSTSSSDKRYRCVARAPFVPSEAITASIEAEKLVIECLELLKNYAAQIATALNTITTTAVQIKDRMDRLDSALSTMTASFHDFAISMQTADAWFDTHIQRLFKLDGSIRFYISSINAQLPAIDKLMDSTNVRPLVMQRWASDARPVVETINAFVTDCLLHAFEEGISDTITALSAQLDALGKLICALKRNCEQFDQELLNEQWTIDGCTAAVKIFCANMFHEMDEVHAVPAKRVRSVCSESARPESHCSGVEAARFNASEGNAPCSSDQMHEKYATPKSANANGCFSYVGSADAFSGIIGDFYCERRFACLQDASIGAAA